MDFILFLSILSRFQSVSNTHFGYVFIWDLNYTLQSCIMANMEENKEEQSVEEVQEKIQGDIDNPYSQEAMVEDSYMEDKYSQEGEE